VKDDYNQAYYGKPVTAQEILSGKVQPSAGARNLLQVLSKY
jgi:lipid-binding SYLF domain-containing protein